MENETARSVMTTEEFKGAVERHCDMVFRLAYAYMRDAADADDVAQNVFVKLLRRKAAFESDDHLTHWLVRVTINECRSLFRKPWRSVEDIDAYARTLALPTREHEELFREVMRLPEKYRIPIILHYWSGYSAGDIAALLRISYDAVRTRLARGRARLRIVLEED